MYPQTLCCAPDYMRERPELRHPGDLVDYDCLTTVLFGTTWPFETPRGALSVEVRSRFHANDGRVIREAARRGLGVAVLPRYLVFILLSLCQTYFVIHRHAPQTLLR